MKAYSEQELISRCKEGKSDAQRMLYDKYSGLVYSICYRYAKNKEDARDLLQEAFISVFKHLENFKGDGSFEGWIRRIAVNGAINFYRQTVRRTDTGDMEYAPELGQYAEVMDNLGAEDLMKIINRLPDGYRVVFNLFAIEGYSHKEIGEQLDITESSSRSQLTRARQMLMTIVEKELMSSKG